MIEVKKTKAIKSTTNVSGVLVQTTEDKWYAVTMYQPTRNPWFLRATSSTSTGRPSNTEVFLKKCSGKPEIQEGVDMLIRVLNGEEPARDRMAF